MGDVGQLVLVLNDGQFDSQGIELAGVFVDRLVRVVNDAPALFSGDAAVAGPHAQAGPARTDLGGAFAAGLGAAVGHRRTEVDLGQARARLGRGVEHRAGSRLHGGFLEVAGFFLVVRRQGLGIGPGDIDLLRRAGRALGRRLRRPPPR